MFVTLLTHNLRMDIDTEDTKRGTHAGIKGSTNEPLIKVEDEQEEDHEDNDSEDDPIVAEYDVFIKPRLTDGREVMVLQFPNRAENQPYAAENHCAPMELRIKPNSGMVELDVPIDISRNYDRDKGVKWGTAMKTSEQVKGLGYGMAAGFGIGATGPRAAAGRGRGRGSDQQEVEPLGRIQDVEFERARHTGNVLKTQTLGGQIDKIESWSPQYMLGTFVDSKPGYYKIYPNILTTSDQLHLTPVDHITQLRPQFHHIDAFAEQDRIGKAPAQARIPEARAVQMIIKNPVDGEEETTDSMAERIAATQAESWRRHKWIDENSPEAWEAYQKNLLVGEGNHDPEELKRQMVSLNSAWTPDEFLDVISAPRDAAKLSRSKVVMKSRSKRKAKDKGKASANIEHDSSTDESSDSDEEAEVVGRDGGAGEGIQDDLYNA